MAVPNRRILAGALGGALGSMAMKAVVRFCDPNAFGLSSQTDAKAARVVFGEGLDQRTAEQIGSAVHYGFGIVTGIGYAIASRTYTVVRTSRGIGFGAGLWLIGDELAVSAARLESPCAASVFSHVSALAAHLIYGVIVEVCVSRAD